MAILTNEQILQRSMSKIALVGDQWKCRVRIKSSRGEITSISTHHVSDDSTPASRKNPRSTIGDPHHFLDRLMPFFDFRKDVSAVIYIRDYEIYNAEIEMNLFSHPDTFAAKTMPWNECFRRIQWFAPHTLKESGEVIITTNDTDIISVRGVITFGKHSSEENSDVDLDVDILRRISTYLQIKNNKVTCYFEDGALTGADNDVRQLIWSVNPNYSRYSSHGKGQE